MDEQRAVLAGTRTATALEESSHTGADRPRHRLGHKAVARCRPARGFPPGTEWCPDCNGYGSSLFEETERCTRCGGSGLVMVADPSQEEPNGQDPAGRRGLS